MRIALPVSACSLLVLLSGCGLIAYPRLTQLPPTHFRSVSVRDAGSRKLLTTATVRYEGHYSTNWARLEPPLDAKPASNLHSYSQPTLMLTASQATPGHFIFQPVRRSEWSHILFPIGLPLGGVLEHYYTSSIIAEAPGHTAIRVSGNPENQRSNSIFQYSDHLTVFLPRTSR